MNTKPPTTMRELTKCLKGMGLTLEPAGSSRSGHARVVRADGVVVARIGAHLTSGRIILNEYKRIQKRAAQEAGGRWHAAA